MKINDLSHNVTKFGNLETAANKQKEEEINTKPAALALVQSAERIELSDTSMEYSSIAEKMEASPQDRAEKIENLKMKIDNGSYHVDSRKIAEKMINDTMFSDKE
jgi:negative regulator of flagellin synthesis FlgM